MHSPAAVQPSCDRTHRPNSITFILANRSDKHKETAVPPFSGWALQAHVATWGLVQVVGVWGSNSQSVSTRASWITAYMPQSCWRPYSHRLWQAGADGPRGQQMWLPSSFSEASLPACPYLSCQHLLCIVRPGQEPAVPLAAHLSIVFVQTDRLMTGLWVDISCLLWGYRAGFVSLTEVSVYFWVPPTDNWPASPAKQAEEQEAKGVQKTETRLESTTQ